MSSYVKTVLNDLEKKYPWESEFLQSVNEVFLTSEKFIESDPNLKKYAILERLVEPERIITFKVPWIDDQGNFRVNMGYRVQFNSALGPYKGGLRFHPTVNQSILKCLGFEQIFKNALTGLPMGGGKGGADFDPSGKSDREIMTFCQSFMTELYKYVGPNIDIPAGDLGVGAREIGYLFGAYKRLADDFSGVLTGKGRNWGGSILRPEATGYGLLYFVDEMLKTIGTSVEGKRVAVSGFGNVAWGAVKKAGELGGKVVAISGPDGYVVDEDGIIGEKLDYLKVMRLSGRNRVEDYADKFKVPFVKGRKPWELKIDLALPCATQNEVNAEDVKNLINNGCIAIGEGANMPLNPEACAVAKDAKLLHSPGKASNAGGVSCSCLEMTQNAGHLYWGPEQVDAELKNIMKNIHDSCYETALEYGEKHNYFLGANVQAIKKVAYAMIDQGCVF